MADEKIGSSPALASSDSDSSRLSPPQDGKNRQANVVVAEKEQRFAAEVLDTDYSDYDLDKNPFADPNVAAYYATVYERSQYECRHVFDPTLEWSAEEEKKIIRKLDWHVCLWAVSNKPLFWTFST